MAEKGQTGRSRLVLLLPLLLGGLNVWLNPHSPPWDAMELAEGEIRLEQLLNWEGDVIFVDARAPESYGAGHLPEAINVYAGDFDEMVLGLLDVWSPEKSVIVYCDSRRCGASGEMAKRLREDFLMERVFVLKGGWESYRKSGG